MVFYTLNIYIYKNDAAHHMPKSKVIAKKKTKIIFSLYDIWKYSLLPYMAFISCTKEKKIWLIEKISIDQKAT